MCVIFQRLHGRDEYPGSEPATQNGREVLEEMKGDPTLTHIPVVILTTSQAEQDILEIVRLQ
jgi:CheY-like chemotaxis protein